MNYDDHIEWCKFCNTSVFVKGSIKIQKKFQFYSDDERVSRCLPWCCNVQKQPSPMRTQSVTDDFIQKPEIIDMVAFCCNPKTCYFVECMRSAMEMNNENVCSVVHNLKSEVWSERKTFAKRPTLTENHNVREY